MSLRNKLVLSTFAVSGVLSLITAAIFIFVASHHMSDSVDSVYRSVARTYSFVQKAVAKGADDIVIQLENCNLRRSNTYLMLQEKGLLIGRVENCVFYGTDFRQVIEFTVNVNDLKWFVAYDRDILEGMSRKTPEFFDRFIKDRIVIDNKVVEGFYEPSLLELVDDSTGYKLVDSFKTLVIDFPILIENSVPVGRVVFVKDFSQMLKEILFTPVVFFLYTIILVVLLSVVLFLLFNKIVRDITLLKNMAYKFKELDFSEIPKLNEMLRKEKTKDELFSLKRSVLTMAQELEDTINKLKMEKEKFEELAYTDPLTGLSNRRFFVEEAKRMLDLSNRYGEPLAVIMMDIDNFKRINDEYGHDIGDLVLKKLSEVIKKNVRSSDIPARFGGEEFIVMLPRTDLKGAQMVAERIRKDFRNASVQINGTDVWTTVSVGVALWEKGDDIDSLIKKADEALYEAKNTGKDRVVIYTGEHQGKG